MAAHPSPVPAPMTPTEDQQALREALAAPPEAPPGALGRLGWIYQLAVTKPLAHGWIYLLILAYFAVMGTVWLVLLFLGLFTWAAVAVAIAGASNWAGVGWATLAYFVLSAITLGLIAAGYNGGLIRLLAPTIVGRRPDPLAFVSGAFTLGPRLFVVFLLAVLLASIPLWWTIYYLWDTFRTWGLSVLESDWNYALQRQVIGAHATNLAILAGTIMAINVLLGPWQVLVGIRRISVVAALPATLGYLVRNLGVTLPVLVINALVVAGLTWLNNSPEYAWWGALLQLIASPMLWLSWIALLAPLAELPPAAVAPPPHPAATPRATPAPAAPPTAEWRNPVPGLLPGGSPPPTA
ncbi:MAG TPA: hypothetical protein VEI97_14380 [bacterium]|nr:hypothetical protein [bacterium]